MIRKFLTNLKIKDAHPSEETLLKCVDGELTPKHAARVRAHLETCWSCRGQLDKIEETISLFVDFRRSVQMPLAAPSPSNWNGFNDKLAEIAAVANDTQKTYWRDQLTSWQKFFSFSAAANFSPLWIRAFAGTAAAILIVALVWQLVIVQTVSASELLEKSVAAQTGKIGATSQEVIYQKLQVKRQNAPAADWEIWQDTTRPRFRQLINHPNIENESENIASDALRELADILRANGMNPQQPLSPASFKEWRDSLADKTDEVSRSETRAGVKFLSLRTTNNSATSVGQISEAVLKVRESDWHPVGELLRVKTANGEEIYELAELDFRVESLTAFQPDFFEEPTAPEVAVVIAPKTIPSPAANASPSLSPSVESSPLETAKTEAAPNAPKVVASADLEVEVLRLLNQAQADLGEQITVEREADGLLYVRGIVETPQRKNEILSALETVKNNPAVRVEINTVAEAVAKEKNKPTQPAKVESVETQSSSIAAENDLIERLGSAESARAFAGQTVNLSGRALRRAYALKRLIGQFKTEELRQMSPDSRAKWLALVRAHAAAFNQENENLRGKLSQVFAAPNVSSSGAMNVSDINDVPRAVEELLKLASANDRVVRSAMAISTGDTQFTAIKTAQFWQSLKTAEALAAKLQRVK